MRSWFNHPFVNAPAELIAKIAWGGVWGMALSSFEFDLKIGFIAMLAGLAGVMSVSFFAYDLLPVDGPRVALYGLLVAGEALTVGAIVLAALGAATGQLEGMALVACAGSGTFFRTYARQTIVSDNVRARLKKKNNTQESAGSKD